MQERHFDPLVCGRYWLSEKLRLGSSVGVEARGAMERQLTDSIYQLLRQSRVEQAGELWQGIDRRVLRAAARARVGQARWLGGWLGLSAMQAHAAIAIASVVFRKYV